MSNTNNIKLEAVHQHDLGVILCKSCNEVIATLPTNGVKKFYSLCDKVVCRSNEQDGKQMMMH
ncbi:GapA-binding peptide SR1P [Paenibacillus sp. SYP-B3998]|uniref:GapA-binding peptide SR1P n=1 Tax=Paenibacillus sp. SYP-B3998 TaxID=2678564 RepID=A0A6G4A1N4_9BACL|nr:GapA-binding peptide SR1P [Paenibacillus sp. SYP-B3998]NEW07739.1 GapA-binding peptide SR1P [Paenibacillus sp. SYP-B3998]